MVSCEHPRVILNPSLHELLCRYHHYIMFGKSYVYTHKYRAFYHLDKRFFHSFRHRITQDTLSECFVVDDSSGEMFPVYLCVPCGHCSICKERKCNDFVQRCQLESELYDTFPLFATLTYDNKHLPSDGVSVRDTQLFLKRLRINLFRHGYFKPIRYVLASHYGTRRKRPHYHIIIWNFAPTDYSSSEELLYLLQMSWGNGEVRRPRWFDPSKPSTLYYTAKYMRHHCDIPDGSNKLFINTSRAGGSIGKPKLNEFVAEFRRSPNVEFKYLSKWKSSPVPLKFNKFVLDTLLPSFCTSIPSEFRTALRQFRMKYFVFKEFHPDLVFLFEDTFNKVKNYDDSFYFGVLSHDDIPLSAYVDDSSLFADLERYSSCIARFSALLPESFKEAYELDRKRRCFLDDPRLFTELSYSDITQRAYHARRRLSRRSYAECPDL